MENIFQLIIDNFIRWGESSDKLYTALMVGSQARTDHPADEYSDIDIVMFVDDPAFFLSSDQWLKDIGEYHVSFTEDSLAGGQEIRVLFDGALDVDFMLFSNNMVHILADELLTVLERGYRILIDKIGVQSIIPALNPANRSFSLLTEMEFKNTVSDFWYHSVWTAKKLKRGELWTAKFCLDSYMKHLLLSIIACHTHVIYGLDYDTWHNGRFIEEWAESWIVERLSLCFSQYNKDDIKNALFSTMALFRAVAVDIAKKLDYYYPEAADIYTTAWVTANLNKKETP